MALNPRPARPGEAFASLIVLSYNRQKYIERSLQSLWRNTTRTYQLIVCDDASSHETVDYLVSLATRGALSTLLLNVGHNMGIGTAFNRGAAIAQGEIMIKLDADLDYKPGWLETVETILNSNPKVGCLGMFKYHHQPCNFPDEVIGDGGDHWVVKDFVGSAIAFRRDIWQVFGPWRQDEHHFSEDVTFKQAVQAHGYTLALTKDDVVENFGFGEQHSSLIRVIDWEHGQHQYNIPTVHPLVFAPSKSP